MNRRGEEVTCHFVYTIKIKDIWLAFCAAFVFHKRPGGQMITSDNAILVL